MPMVNGKKFPYTAKGIAAAKKAAKKDDKNDPWRGDKPPMIGKEAKEKFDKGTRQYGRLESTPQKLIPKITDEELAKARKSSARREALKKLNKGKMK